MRYVVTGVVVTTYVVLLALAASTASGAERRVIRSECIGNRCALYEKGRRVGSVTRYDSGRAVVRDRRGREVARGRVDRGTVTVEETRRRR